jgi:ABC-type transport system involved in multi-copper enzyme maturation permease subunit
MKGVSGRVLAIAGNTFRENVRDKILYNLVVFALLMIASSVALGQLTLGHTDKVIVDLGLSSISVIGTLIAIFIGISLVYKEIEKRTVYALLAKPLFRWELILGKFLGLVFTLTVNVLIMTAGLLLTLTYHTGAPRGGYLRILPAVYLILVSLALVTAVALVFSTFSTPALSALFTFFLWVIGHFNSDLLELGQLTHSRAMATVGKLMYYALPNFSNFGAIDSRNVILGAAYYRPIDPGVVLWVTLYGAVYTALLVLVASVIFSKRDFK